MRKLFLVLAGLLALAAVLLTGGRWWLSTAEADHARDARLPGLDAPVEVWRDSLAVPHLWARSERDLVRALGYVHAQDRLWQMEFLRRVAEGRLAEILGRDLVDADRTLRTLGMGRAAARNLEALDAGQRSILEAYAEGVNAWIADRPGALPPEFVALRFEPEPWSPRHTLGIAKVMSWDLAESGLGLDLQRAVDRLGAERAADLFPVYPEWGDRIVEPGAATAFSSAEPAPGRLPPVAGPVPVPRLPDAALAILDAVSVRRASNAWVVGGDRTRSGKPILANDPHLALRAPALWYLAALHGGDISVAGATIPGIPGVLLGHTPRVAWGFTNAMVDDVDLYVEEVDPADPDRYRTPSGWARFEVRPETIAVRSADPVVHRVRASRHGPILSDVDPRGGDRVLAMRWTALEPSRAVGAMLGMNRARDAAALLDALRAFDEPHMNVVFADADGRFGFWLAGRVPVRRSGDGVLPVRGWTDEGAWERYLSWEERPHLLDPAAGFVVTANNPHWGPGAPAHVGTNYFGPFRAARIREMISAGRSLTAADVAAQQMDVNDVFARRYLPHARRAAADAGAREAETALAAWDGDAAADSHAAAVFYTWYEELRRRVGDDEFGDGPVYFSRFVMNRVLDGELRDWADDVRTPRRESLEELSAEAMRAAVEFVAGRGWGEVHSARSVHPLAAVRVLDGLLGLDVGPFPSPGSPFTVNVASYGRRPPFETDYGPSMRHVVDLADPDSGGGFVVPTGQSGVPTSRHYRDQAPLWRTGRLWPIPLDRERASARIVERLVLRP